MIISASRRTDIPAFYSEWFINRLNEGYVLVPNPFNTSNVSRISLNPEIIECIVLWTKNPSPLLGKLREIDKLGFNYYFQFTITSYNQNIEENIPPKRDIIRTFKELSDKIGKERVIWRYDPVLLSPEYSIDYHKKWFAYLVEKLSGYTTKCVISFIDMYKKCEKNMANIPLRPIDDTIKKELVHSFSKRANDFGVKIESCAEILPIPNVGLAPSKCIDDQLISKIIGAPIAVKKDKSQRNECGCVESVDIGSYGTCMNGCNYCYANYNQKVTVTNYQKHEIYSPLLVGNLNGDEKITERKIYSLRNPIQRSLFK